MFPLRPRPWVSGLCAMLLMAAVSGASADEGQSLASPVNRLHRVDDRLYRGAQPTDEGFRHLRDLGVKTVINLRLAEDAEEIGEQRIVESFGMRYVNIPVRDGNFFTWFRRIPDESVHAFLQAVDGAEPGPVFVHCRRGTDRTGAMVAFYRIARSGWEQARAVKEAEDVGMRPWYRGLRRQIKAFEPTTAVRTSQ